MQGLSNSNNINVNKLHTEITNLIEQAKRNMVTHVNSELILLYWNIGKNIKKDILYNNKPEYGKSVVEELGKRLTLQYGRGFSYRNIFRMLKFYEYYNDYKILTTMSSKLS